MKRLSIRKFKRMMLVFLFLVAPASIAPLTGCNTPSNKIKEQEQLKQLYKKDGYYNRFPIQVYIDDSFSAHNYNLIKTSLIELDDALEGLKFEYNEKRPSFQSSEYSYINIQYDKDGSLNTEKAYEQTGKKYAFASVPRQKRGHHLSPVDTFESTITLGGYFMISEDIPKSNKLMGLELKWDNYNRFAAYVDSTPFKSDRYWNFWTSYNDFRNSIETALKGVTKHEAIHSLNFQDDNKGGCNNFGFCHTTDKNSLMYPYTIAGGAIRKNKVTSDVVEFMKKKYPKDKEMGD